MAVITDRRGKELIQVEILNIWRHKYVKEVCVRTERCAGENQRKKDEWRLEESEMRMPRKIMRATLKVKK